jgi:RNA polymerase sigma-70 factor (ECF subfamily)
MLQRSSAASGEALIRMLYQEHGNALLTYATRLTGDQWVAEDVIQETLLRAWRHADVLNEEAGSIRGWLFTVARNLVVDRARRTAARPAEVAAGYEATERISVGDHAQRVVDSMVALDVLERLSEEHRAVVVELYIRGRSGPEAAEALGIPIGTVKSRAHRALRGMRDLMGYVPIARQVAAG